MAAIYKPNKERNTALTDEDMGKLVGFIKLLKEIDDKK